MSNQLSSVFGGKVSVYVVALVKFVEFRGAMGKDDGLAKQKADADIGKHCVLYQSFGLLFKNCLFTVQVTLKVITMVGKRTSASSAKPLSQTQPTNASCVPQVNP